MKKYCLPMLICLLLCACRPGPTEPQIGEQLQQTLDSVYGKDTFKIESLERRGSQANSVDPSNNTRIIYFKAGIRLLKRYHPAASPTRLHQLLGAAGAGISGLKPNGNQKGELLTANGLVVVEHLGDSWKLVGSHTPQP